MVFTRKKHIVNSNISFLDVRLIQLGACFCACFYCFFIVISPLAAAADKRQVAFRRKENLGLYNV